MPTKRDTGRGKSDPVGTHDSHLLGVQSLVTNNLYDADGNRVGKLEEIVLDVRTGCVRHVIVATGGFLGLGRRRFAIPWSALRPDARYCRAVVDVAQMRLTAVPIADDDPWLRRPASASLATVALPKVNRAFGAAD
jgi:sporulation protein YlmC with PRC-barrel domain